MTSCVVEGDVSKVLRRGLLVGVRGSSPDVLFDRACAYISVLVKHRRYAPFGLASGHGESSASREAGTCRPAPLETSLAMSLACADRRPSARAKAVEAEDIRGCLGAGSQGRGARQVKQDERNLR